jgi:ELWxxDGT repeat protein
VQVADIVAGGGSSAPSQLTAGGSGVAFTAWNAAGRRQLHLFDGATVSVLSALARGESIAALTWSAGSFWFRAHTAARGHELWRTTPGGIALVHDLRAGAGSSFPSNLEPFGTGVLFRADDGATGFEYWRTDGATAAIVQDIRSGPCPSRPARLARLGPGRSRYLFAAKGTGDGIELYRTDGATASQVQDIDPLAVLPGMHWGTSPTAITLEIKDGAPSRPGLLIVGTSVVSPFIRLPFVRGAVAVNLAGPLVLLGFQTDRLGNASFSFPPITPQAPTSIVSQAVSYTSAAFVSISAPGSCNQGSKDLDPGAGGPKVEGRICLDDESGEYSLCAERVDALATPAYIGLYQKGPGGDLNLLQCYPISAGDIIEDSGQIEILLPLDIDDPVGRHLEMHLFHEPPAPDSASPASLVTTSYC